MYTYKLLDSDNHTIYASDYQKKRVIIKKLMQHDSDTFHTAQSQENSTQQTSLIHQMQMMKLIKKNTTIRIPAIYKCTDEEIWMEKFDTSIADIRHLCTNEALVKYIIRYVINMAYQLKHAQIYVPLTINHILLNIKDPIDLLSHKLVSQQLSVEIGLCGTLNASIMLDRQLIDKQFSDDIKITIQQFTTQLPDKSGQLKSLLNEIDSMNHVSQIYKSDWLKIPMILQLQRQIKWQLTYDTMLQHILTAHKKQIFDVSILSQSSIGSSQSDDDQDANTLVIQNYFRPLSTQTSMISVISSEDFKDIVSQ